MGKTRAPSARDAWPGSGHAAHHALFRDSLLAWAKFINETIELYGDDTEVKFQAHHWPMWGNAKIIDYWKKQRDLYKYIHDQSVNLMNIGYTGVEISNIIKLPPELDKAW